MQRKLGGGARLQAHALPEAVDEEAEFLRAADGRNRDEDLAAAAHGGVHGLEELALARAPRVAHRCAERALRDEEVWPQARHARRAEVAVCGHVVIARVEHGRRADGAVHHGGAEHVAGVVGRERGVARQAEWRLEVDGRGACEARSDLCVRVQRVLPAAGAGPLGASARARR